MFDGGEGVASVYGFVLVVVIIDRGFNGVRLWSLVCMGSGGRGRIL